MTMKIQSLPTPTPRQGTAPQPEPPKVKYNHLPEDRVQIRHPLAALAGASVGIGGGVALAQYHPWLGLATGLAAAGVGFFLGNSYDKLAYSLEAKGRQWRNRSQQKQAEGLKQAETLKPEVPSFRPLGKKDLLAARSTGTAARAYDGYDSSRDIAALYAREGKPQEAYAIEVEMAHLRPAAEHGHLDTHLQLDWGQKDPLKVKIDIDQDQAGVSARHSEVFKRVQLRVDKEKLRHLGWNDGQPVRIQVSTSGENGLEQGTSIEARSDQPQNSDKIFRWEGKTVYYATTDRFQNGDKSNDQGSVPGDPQRFHGGDWQGIIDKLDYIKDLNVDCIWISCPYEGQRDFFGLDGFHGYWPMDFSKAEPAFGTREKLKELTQKAHEKGMKVMLDVVLNHTGYGHPFTTDPEKKDWFHANGNISGLGQWSMENGSLCGLPDLAQENPKVARYLIDVHKDWLQDADAFRLDALRHMPEEFVREFSEAMHEAKPDFYGVGEAFWLNANFVSGYQNRTTDSMFDFPLAYAIRRTFAGDPSRGLKERVDLWKEVKPHASEHEAARVLLDSHKSQDMSLLSKVLQEDSLYDNPAKLGTLIDNHDMVRFMSDTAGDVRRLEQALAFLYGVRGTPHVYYGTEVAMEGIGPANRNDMEWGKNPEFTERFRQITAARSGSEALQYGSQQELHCDKDSYAFARMRPDEEVVCLFNKSDEATTLRFPLHPESPVPDGAQMRDMLDEGSVTVREHELEVTVPAKGYRFLQWKS